MGKSFAEKSRDEEISRDSAKYILEVVKMASEFEAFSPSTEVKGNAIQAIVNGIMRKELAYNILARHGITKIEPDKWYPEQSWLDAFHEIATELGDAALYAIGRALPPLLDLPPGVNSVEEAIEKIDEIYKAHHRGQAGGYKATMTGNRSAQIISENPRPCAYDMGLLTAFIEHFNGGAPVKIRHEDDMCCRKLHHHDCVYFVSW